MKNRFLLLCFTAFIGAVFAQNKLNVMTFNIRLNIPVDSLNGWQYRKDKVASQVLFHNTHILGVQEALPNQMMDLQQALPQFKYVGVGRNDNKDWAEFSAIFYDTTRLIVLRQATFWLSETPTQMGVKGWDAAFPRIVTYAYFKDKRTKQKFYVFNTHFDHKGIIARRESAKFLLAQVKDIAGTSPTVIMGDFNAKPTDEPIEILMNTTHLHHFIDSKTVSATPHYGPTGTFNGFQAKEESDQPIDYIFIKNKVKVHQHATLSQTWGGRFSSDHFPVLAIISIF